MSNYNKHALAAAPDLLAALEAAHGYLVMMGTDHADNIRSICRAAIFKAKGLDTNDVANARLIAAAPSMKAVCERVLARWYSHDGQMDKIDDLLWALAAATGKEPEAIMREAETASQQMLRELYWEDDSA